MQEWKDSGNLSSAKVQNKNKKILFNQHQQLPTVQLDSPQQNTESVENSLEYQENLTHFQQISQKYEQQCITFIQNIFVELNQNFSLLLLNLITNQNIKEKQLIDVQKENNNNYCQQFQEKAQFLNYVDEKLSSIYYSIIELANSQNFVKLNYQTINIPNNDRNVSKIRELDIKSEQKRLEDFWGNNEKQEQKIEPSRWMNVIKVFQETSIPTIFDNQFFHKPKFDYLQNSFIKFSSKYFYGPIKVKNNSKSVQTDGKGLILFDGFIDQYMDYSFKLQIIPITYDYFFELGLIDWNNFTFPKLKTEQTGIYSFNNRLMIMIDGDYKVCHRIVDQDPEFLVTYDKECQRVVYQSSQKVIFDLKNVKKTNLTFFARIYKCEINII